MVDFSRDSESRESPAHKSPEFAGNRRNSPAIRRNSPVT
jgi:hypothetical protein